MPAAWGSAWHANPNGHASVLPDLHAVRGAGPVSYTHLRAHETVLDLVCRLLLEKKKKHLQNSTIMQNSMTYN